MIAVQLLGGLGLRGREGEALSFTTRKAEAVLALLALRPGQAYGRDKLCGLLWPNVPDAQARHSLRQTLLCLRKGLDDAGAVLRADSRTLALDAGLVQVDLALLEQHVEQGTREALARAATLYRGELLDGLSIDEAPFQHWLSFERERVRGMMSSALTRLIALHTAADALDAAIQTCTLALRVDPLCEGTHRLLMRAYARYGRRSSALQHYQRLVRTLREELGTEPQAETRELFAELERAVGHTHSGPHSSRTLSRVARVCPQARATPAPEPAPAIEWIVSRNSELNAVHEHYQQAGVCVLFGEAGIGKTHLCERFAAAMQARGVRTLRARCFESEQVLPFSLWANLLEVARTQSDSSLLFELEPNLRAQLGPLLGDLDPQSSGPGRDVLSLFRAVQALVNRWSQSAPLVLVLEDLHWADEMSLRLLCFLSRGGHEQHDYFMLATARTEEMSRAPYLLATLAELEREQLLRRIDLTPLSQSDSRMLAEQAAAQLQLSPPDSLVFDQIWSLSEGNPLVIVECARALAQGALAADVARLPVPERVRTLIQRRIARTSPAARELLSFAAVIGRELELGLLRYGAAREADFVAALEELVDAHLVLVRDERVCFVHERIREVLYTQMLPARRRLLHATAAAALEEQCASRLEPALGPIGYHYSKAAHVERAIDFLTRFADYAWRCHGAGEALAALEQAHADSAGLSSERAAAVGLGLVLRQAFCLLFLGRVSDLVERLQSEQARLVALDQPLLAGPFHFWWGFALTMQGEPFEAERHALLAREQAERCDDTRIMGYAHALVSYVCWVTGRFGQGEREGQTAIQRLELITDVPEALGLACVGLAYNQMMLGHWREALVTVDRAAASQSERLQAIAWSARAHIYSGTLRWGLAIDAGQHGLALSKDPFTRVEALLSLTAALVGGGQAVAAQPLLNELTAQLHRDGMVGWDGYTRIELAKVALHVGDPARARVLATEALEIARTTSDANAPASALRVRGLAALAQRELTHARMDLTQALALSNTSGAPIESAHAHIALARLEQAAGDCAAAARHFQRAHDCYEACDIEQGCELARASLREPSV